MDVALLIQISTNSFLVQKLKLRHIGACSKHVTDAETLGDKPVGESETEEGGAYDAGAEFTGLQLLFLTPDERISRWRRLYKNRANTSLVFYHKHHPDCYEFTHVRLNDVFDFIEGYFAYLHMNFKARNVATGSEQIFFPELMAEMDNNDNASNGYYRVSACDIVDGNSAGKLLFFLSTGFDAITLFLFYFQKLSNMHCSCTNYYASDRCVIC
nr:uncharacterized protein LOC120964804 [Aegilops tauschii subsp. strangulata]